MSQIEKRSMNAPGTSRRTLKLSPLIWLLGLGACTSVLGIEDLHEGPRDGSAGDLNAAGDGVGTAGKDSSGGSSSNGGKDASGGSSGTSTGGKSSGGTNPGGGSGLAGAPDNAAGAGGSPIIPGDPTVHGHLIDFWGHKLANIAVQIGNTLTTTDDNGAFQIADVPATYDVSLAMDLDPDRNGHSYGWVFQGLTRRDPTLQVIRGLSIRESNIVVTPKNAVIGNNQQISVVIGGPDGFTDLGSVGPNGKDTSAYWEGGDTAQQMVHSLFFTYDTNTELPTSYFSADTEPALLVENMTTNVQLTLPKTALDAGNLQGTATTGGGSGRENQVFVRYTSTGAALRVVDDSPGPNTFSYLVPSIPSTTLTVAASEGYDSVNGPYALVHADGLSASAKPALKIPSVPTLTTPATSISNVNSTTKFAFQSPASNPGPFLVRFSNIDQTGIYQTLYVVTASKQVTIPEVIGGGFKLQAGKLHEWNVETHGSFASVDAMANPKGYLDSFGATDTPVGPASTGGFYTVSAGRTFTTAP